MERPNYYQLLGVDHDASLAAIKRAFRRLARQYRPERTDITPPALAELQLAYETLTDAERRRRYDEQLREQRVWPSVWSHLRRPAASDLRRPLMPARLAAEVVLDATTSSRGTMLSLDIPITVRCDACDGTGGSVFDCGRCRGEGTVGRRLPVPLHVPPGTRDGTVLEVRTEDPAVPSILLTVHLQRLP